MGGGRVFNPFPGVGGFDWSIFRIDAGGLDGSLAVVGTCFLWGVFVPVRPHAAEGVWERDQVRGGAGAGFFAAIWMLLSVVSGTGSMSLKVLGYSPCRSRRSQSTCCGSNLCSWCCCWQGHQTGGICLPNTQQESSCTTVQHGCRCKYRSHPC
jgi:hypothetical protein